MRGRRPVRSVSLCTERRKTVTPTFCIRDGHAERPIATNTCTKIIAALHLKISLSQGEQCRLLCGKMLLRAYESSNTMLLAFSGTACWKDMHMNSLFWQSEPLGRHHDEVDSHGHSAHTGRFHTHICVQCLMHQSTTMWPALSRKVNQTISKNSKT